MNQLLSELKSFHPWNEEEAMDCKNFTNFLENNKDAYYRTNLAGHVTSSGWIVNKQHTKVLMIYHNIYHSWSWTGGHADGEIDLCHVAIKEAQEETHIKNLTLLQDTIFSVEVLTVDGHIKKGHYVSSHLHYNVTYLFEAEENQQLQICPEENNGVKWIKLEDVEKECTEPWMIQHVYNKLSQKLLQKDKNSL